MSSGRAMAPIFLATCCRSSSTSAGGSLRAVLQGDERRDRLALELVRAADDRRFGDRRMVDERALDLHRADAVAGDVQHVVDAAEEPEVAVVVALGAVAGEVDAVRPLAEVLLHVALAVAVDAAQHGRPRLASAPAGRRRPRPPRRSALRISAVMPGNGCVAEPGLVVVSPGSGEIMMGPVSVCHHVSTIGQRSPPMYSWYHIHASGLIGSPTEPSRRRLREIVRLPASSVAPAHEGADRGRRGVEDRHAVALDDLPEAVLAPASRARLRTSRRSRRWRAGRRRRSCGRSPSRCRPCTSRRRRPSGRRPTWWWRSMPMR